MSVVATARERLVLVTWKDSAILAGGRWMAREDAVDHEVALCYSVGWVLHDDDDRLVLAASVGPEEVSEVTAIPRECIASVCDLRKK